jgi:chemotaxis protein methyltransferase WspC
VIVPETWFFRYPNPSPPWPDWPAVASELAGARLRILSLPCASGEEPYSIAMALLDAGLPEQSFQIDALDISPAMLERASTACTGATPSAAANWASASAISSPRNTATTG